MKEKYILASGSPRRKEILNLIGIEFEVIKSGCEECAVNTEPEEMVKELAGMKSRDVASQIISGNISVNSEYGQDIYIIGANTMVFYNGMALGKPKDEEDAVSMLSMLSGNTHQVCTGVSVLRIVHETGGLCVKDSRSFSETTHVSITDMSKDDILEYISTGDYKDKAGSYGIQGLFSRYVRKIDGDYFNVVGFPACRFYTELKYLKSSK